MNRRRTRLTLIFVVLPLGLGCHSPFYADRGAAVGGVTGAGLGALIGEAHDNAAAGALIGSAVGATAGSVVGNQLDDRIAAERARASATPGSTSAGVTFGDVVQMSQAGLSDDVISNHLRGEGLATAPTSYDLIALKTHGVSDGVLQYIQHLANSERAAPVMIEQQVVEPMPPLWAPAHFHHRAACVPFPYRRHRGPAWSWGFSIAQ